MRIWISWKRSRLMGLRSCTCKSLYTNSNQQPHNMISRIVLQLLQPDGCGQTSLSGHTSRSFQVFMSVICPYTSGILLSPEGVLEYKTVIEASHPLMGSSYGVTDFFFLLLLPKKIAFTEGKHNERNLALSWYFRKTFWWIVFRTSLINFFLIRPFSPELWLVFFE